VIHVLDASRAVGVASQLLSARRPKTSRHRSRRITSRCARRGRARAGRTCCSGEAPRMRSNGAWRTRRLHLPAGLHVFADWDWQTCANASTGRRSSAPLGTGGTYPAILDATRSWRERAQLVRRRPAMLDWDRHEKWLTRRRMRILALPAGRGVTCCSAPSLQGRGWGGGFRSGAVTDRPHP